MTKTLKNGCRLSNRHPFFLFQILLSFSVIPLFTAPVVHASAPANIAESPLAKADPFQKLKYATPELSIRLIDEYQPKPEALGDAWFLWEQKRLQLLAELGQWQSALEQIAGYDEAVLVKHKAWLSLFKARALLKVSQPFKVRHDLRELLWSAVELTPEQIATTRRLLIRSYLAEGKAYDAQRAMLRYQQDYGVSGVQWRLLQARVLLATKRYPEAMRLLATEKADNLQAFKILTRLRAGEVTASRVYELARKKTRLRSTTIDAGNRRQYWILAYIASAIKNDKKAAIEALEQALVTGVADAEYDLINISAELLWQKYLEYAADLGNQLQLLIGDDKAWFNTASNRFEHDPVAARAIFAMLGLNSATETQRNVSLEQLVLLMKKTKKQSLLIERLFTDPVYFKSIDRVPVLVRYQMLDNALSMGDIKQAAALFKDLPEPPEGKKRLAWDMRRARVLVFGGQYQQAKDVLDKILNSQSLDGPWLNRLMQVVFDLQKVDQHLIAIELFELIEMKTTEKVLHRELKFWMAESYQALKKYERSAHLYLSSAKMIADKSSDPWAQTALYRAAEAMMQAGIINDARSLYQELLKVTDSKSRRANIEQKLQQLWLLEGKQSNSEQS